MHWNTNLVGEFDVSNWFGFIYLIRNKLTDQKYIGKKQFNSRRRHKVKGKKNRKVVITESDWATYTSSSEELNELIESEGKDIFEFTILKLCATKRDLGYAEVEEQMARDVLRAKLPNGIREYYNRNIMSRWFVAPEEHSKETKAKLAAAASLRKHSDETKKKMSDIRKQRGLSKGALNPNFGGKYNYGRVISNETREKISHANKGKEKSLEQRKKMSIAAKNRKTSNGDAMKLCCLCCHKIFNKGNFARHVKAKNKNP